MKKIKLALAVVWALCAAPSCYLTREEIARYFEGGRDAQGYVIASSEMGRDCLVDHEFELGAISRFPSTYQPTKHPDAFCRLEGPIVDLYIQPVLLSSGQVQLYRQYFHHIHVIDAVACQNTAPNATECDVDGVRVCRYDINPVTGTSEGLETPCDGGPNGTTLTGPRGCNICKNSSGVGLLYYKETD